MVFACLCDAYCLRLVMCCVLVVLLDVCVFAGCVIVVWCLMCVMCPFLLLVIVRCVFGDCPLSIVAVGCSLIACWFIDV